MKQIEIFTDGGCEGNPGPGAWAAILRYGATTREITGGAPATTNNRMELQAAIEALRALKEPCAVRFFTDSQYLREGITQWVAGWKARGWMLSTKKPVKNDDLWRELDALVSGHRVEWHWVRGHAGHPENERCDLLAQEEMARIRQQYSREELRRFLEEFETRRQSAKSVGMLL